MSGVCMSYWYIHIIKFKPIIDSRPNLCDNAKKVLELRDEEFSIVCNAIKAGMNEGTIRPDLDPVEVTVFLTLIVKALTEMRPNFKKVLESRSITPYQFFKDAAGFVHYMLANTEKKDTK